MTLEIPLTKEAGQVLLHLRMERDKLESAISVIESIFIDESTKVTIAKPVGIENDSSCETTKTTAAVRFGSEDTSFEPFEGSKRRINLSGVTTYAAVEICLREAGRPMTIAEIAKQLLASGWKTQSRNPSTIVANALRTKPHLFFRCGGHQWALPPQVLGRSKENPNSSSAKSTPTR